MDNHLKIIMNNVNNLKIDVYLMSFMINKMSNILLSHFEFKSRVVYKIFSKKGGDDTAELTQSFKHKSIKLKK